MTSANVINYRILREGKNVGSHRYNILCKPRWEPLLRFQPLEAHTIQAWGYDEDESPWENEETSLRDFLIARKVGV